MKSEKKKKETFPATPPLHAGNESKSLKWQHPFFILESWRNTFG
jgi:hypothetical protein